MAQTTFLQAEILSKDICAYEDEIDTFAVALKSSQVSTQYVVFYEKEKQIHSIPDTCAVLFCPLKIYHLSDNC